MGFLVFSYRKLHLKRKINELSYRQMVLSQRQQTIANNVSIVQRAMAAQKSNVEQFGKLLSSVAAMKFQSIPGMLQAPTTNPYTEEGKADWAKYQEAQQKVSMANYFNNMMRTNAQNAISQVVSMTGSIFDAQSELQLAPLNAESTQIELELAGIESQLTAMRAELQSVESAEKDAAQNSAPKFGLG